MQRENIWMPPTMSPDKNHRIGKACEQCNKRKIRCKPQIEGRCEACIEHGLECIARTRKKRTPRAHQSSSSRQRREVTEGSLIPDIHSQIPISPGLLAAHRSNSVSGGRYWYEDTLSRLASDKVPPATPPLEVHEESDNEAPEFITHNSGIDETSPKDGMGAAIDVDFQTLQLRNAYELPPRSIRESLNDAFMERCYPWTPIIERSWLEETSGRPVSLLLMQSVFLAASRVLSSPSITAYATPREFYQRAKTLFWTGHERDALMTIRAACILNWFNPHGPEQVSFDTSRFWNHIAVGLSHQINLHKEPPPGRARAMRRRLWWSLVVRDSLLSASHGRPRAINLDDCDVRPLCSEDFPNSALEADFFKHYVEVCTMLGDITEGYSRKHISRHHKERIQNSMSHWTKDLPEELQLFQKSSKSSDLPISRYNFNARQLHVPYFVVLTIMHKTITPNAGPSVVSILAASYIAGIFEDFLARGEIQYLPAIFTFYGLAAAVSLVSFHRYLHLRTIAEQDLAVIMSAELELGKRWPTALGMRSALETMIASISKVDALNAPTRLEVPKMEVESYFSAFGSSLCRIREAVLNPPSPSEANHLKSGETAAATFDLDYTVATTMNTDPSGWGAFPLGQPGFEAGLTDGMFDFQHDDAGFWLFDNSGADFPLQ